MKFKVYGKNLEECFKNAAHNLIKTLCNEDINLLQKKTIKIHANDKESLLYNLLEKILYFLEIGDFLVWKIKDINITVIPKIKGNRKFYNLELLAEVYGDNIDNYKINKRITGIKKDSISINTISGITNETDRKKIFECRFIAEF